MTELHSKALARYGQRLKISGVTFTLDGFRFMVRPVKNGVDVQGETVKTDEEVFTRLDALVDREKLVRDKFRDGPTPSV